MSAALTRLPLSQAERLAQEVLELLAPACERIEIAGSIRRRKVDVGDIELLAVPRLEAQLGGLFGTEAFTVNQLDLLVTRLMAAGELQLRQPRALGSKYKRLLFRDVPLDLFVVTPPAQWGWLMLIRTGPADFSHRLVTPQNQHGWLPNWAKARDGGVYHEQQKPGVDAPYPMPEERDAFEFLKLAYIPPELRQ